uniref:Cyclic nucleotide-binding domain-containing protein n=1 Tax=Anopheles atroparvus TaxID=41427 RepID=A0AAG5DSM5_ANOAO
MSSRQKHRVEVPDELKDVLLRFAIAYLLEQPDDLIEYALTFFAKERDGRKPVSVSSVAPDSTTTTTSTTACQRVLSPEGKGNRCDTCAPKYDAEDGGVLPTFPKTDKQRAQLHSALSQLFRCLDQQQMNDMFDAMCEKMSDVRAKDYMDKQGADGANIYVTDSGVYVCCRGDDRQHIRTFDNGGSFGEPGVLKDFQHCYPLATSIQQDGKLRAIDRQTFERIVQRAAGRKRKADEALLSAVPMLKLLESHERAYLVDGLVPRTYARGDQILLQDDAADGLYFVEQGTVSVRSVEDADEVELARVEQGGYFGELTLVTHWPQEVSVWAVDDVRVAFLAAEAFLQLRAPRVLARLQRTIGDMQVQHVQVFGSHNNLIDIW